MENKHPFVVLEGTSGVGKSTVARLLADTLEAELVKTPMVPFDDVRGTVDEACLTVQGRYLFYLATVAEASERIRGILERKPVVCDRYLLSTECYHRALGLNVELDYQQLGLVTPDATVLLTCSEAVRKARVDRRGWSFNDLQEERLAVTARFEAEYRKHEVAIVDTSNLTPAEVRDRILVHLPGQTTSPSNQVTRGRSADMPTGRYGSRLSTPRV